MSTELTILLKAIKKAGNAVLGLQQRGFTVGTKASGEIVTQADLLANALLKEELTQAFPNYGWLSEESKDDKLRLSCERTWVVDPIDGTKEYAKGLPEYAVSVALVEHHQPLLAAVYNPAVDELYYAEKGKGAWLWDKKIYCQSYEREISLLASRSEYERREWDHYPAHVRIQPMGSIAYKLARVAAGLSHATFSLGPKHEWDIAAGVLLVAEAGGKVSNKYRKDITFNQQTVLVDGVVASGLDINEEIFTLIRHSF